MSTFVRWALPFVLAGVLGSCTGTESGNPQTVNVGAGSGAGNLANAGVGGTGAATGGMAPGAGMGAGGGGAGALDAGAMVVMDAGDDEDGGAE